MKTIAKSATTATAVALASASNIAVTVSKRVRSKNGSKGDIMEQNQDGLEYSDEGEEEDLQQAMDTYSSATLGKVNLTS